MGFVISLDVHCVRVPVLNNSSSYSTLFVPWIEHQIITTLALLPSTTLSLSSAMHQTHIAGRLHIQLRARQPLASNWRHSMKILR